MKILILSKRQYMSKDLLLDRYGRFREIPLELAQRGHIVNGACLSYTKKYEQTVYDKNDDQDKVVVWKSFNAGTIKPLGWQRYAKKVLGIAKTTQPDIIWACSDMMYGVLGVDIAKKINSKCVIDCYDIFEKFESNKIPFLSNKFKSALKSADGITVYNQYLGEYIQKEYKTSAQIKTLLNGVAPDTFKPREKSACRKHFKLNEDANIIVYTGAIVKDRDLNTLFQAFNELSENREDLTLVLAGPKSAEINIPESKNIIVFDSLSNIDVAKLNAAADVSIISNEPVKYSEFIYPTKSAEIIACKTPIIASAVGAMKTILADFPENLYDSGNVMQLKERISQQLDSPTNLDLFIPTWSELAEECEKYFEEII